MGQRLFFYSKFKSVDVGLAKVSFKKHFSYRKKTRNQVI